MTSFPNQRLRRLRHAPWVRGLTQEHRLHPSDLIWPLFITEQPASTPIAALEGQFRHALQDMPKIIEQACSAGIQAVALFPATDLEKKDARGKEALNPDNLICKALRILKKEKFPIGVIADVALDPYTTHGHDGILDANGRIANDATVAILCKQALLLAENGADMLAPSDMMDGRITAIRTALETHGHHHTCILSYTAKYASALYQPFRAAIGACTLGAEDPRIPKDKSSYQMHPANAEEAVLAAQMQVNEGADCLMVKPASFYLDVVARLAESQLRPVFAYQVSGEYAMLKALAANDPVLGFKLFEESLLACKRAGARNILSYYALDYALAWKKALT